MFRLSEMIGKTVVSTESGEKLGTVSDALVDLSGVRLMGLVVGHGMLGREQVLPVEDVQTVGRDTILAKSNQHMMDPRDWRTTQAESTRTSQLHGRPVVTGAGQRLGQVKDLLVEEGTGKFAGLEVGRRSMGGLRRHRSVISPPATPRIGPDAVVVPEEAVPAAADARGRKG